MNERQSHTHTPQDVRDVAAGLAALRAEFEAHKAAQAMEPRFTVLSTDLPPPAVPFPARPRRPGPVRRFLARLVG